MRSFKRLYDICCKASDSDFEILCEIAERIDGKEGDESLLSSILDAQIRSARLLLEQDGAD